VYLSHRQTLPSADRTGHLLPTKSLPVGKGF
jgi:hypothetical protein